MEACKVHKTETTLSYAPIKLGSLKRRRGRTTVITALAKFLAVVLAVLCLFSDEAGALKCFCDPNECDVIRPEDCPGKGLIIKDPCK